MYSLFCMSRGRRPGLHWKPSEVHNEEGEPIAGIGLFNGADAIETGEFIGFYTGHWKEKASAYKGSNDYMFALCADYPADWHVCPTIKVDTLPSHLRPEEISVRAVPASLLNGQQARSNGAVCCGDCSLLRVPF